MKIRNKTGLRRIFRKLRGRSYTRREWCLLALGAWYLLGVGLGAWMSRGSADGARRTAAFFAPHRWSAAMADAARPTVLFAVAFGLTGLSLAGVATAPGLLLLRGVGIGWLLGSLTQTGTSRAWWCAMGYALPFSCWTAVLYMVQVREAVCMAAGLRSGVCGSQASVVSRLRQYGRRTVILLGIGFAGSLLQAAIAMAIRAYAGTG